MTVMLYAKGGPHKIHGGDFDYVIVEESQVKDAVKKGWSLTTTDAIKKANPKPKAKVKTKTKE